MPATVRIALLIVIPYILVIAPVVLVKVAIDQRAHVDAPTGGMATLG